MSATFLAPWGLPSFRRDQGDYEVFEDVQSPQDIQNSMADFRRTNCEDISAADFAQFARRIAEILPRGIGMRRGIIAPLGELWSCVRFDLKLMDEGNKGSYAISVDEKKHPVRRYRIKSRHPEKGELVNPSGTTPRFTSLDFDQALLVLMDKDLQNYETWTADVRDVEKHLRPGRNDMHIALFQRIGRRVYPPILNP